MAPSARAELADTLIAAAHTAHLADTPGWRRQVHYQPRWFGGWRSELDAPGYFLAPEGKTNPQAELDATIRAFFAPPVATQPVESFKFIAQHPLCRFPARRAWLAAQLGDRVPNMHCAEFETWRARLAGRRVTLVFADAYLNNPASMFGHTLLRLDRADGSDLLAYAVNYSAANDEVNPLIYVVAGILGGFDGFYATMPYYLKVREYGNVEHRDLWEYPVRLNTAQVDQLLRYLWGRGAGPSDYFYFDENCSQQLLEALEIAFDGSMLPLSTPWVIPADTVRAAVDAGLLGRPKLRASKFRLMNARRAALTEAEAAQAYALVMAEQPPDLSTLPPGRQAQILDAADALISYRWPRSAPAEVQIRADRLLRARGQLRRPSTPVIIERPTEPHRGHGTGMIAIGAGVSHGSHYLEATLRPALRDLADPTPGYVAGARIEMLTTTLRLDKDGPLPDLERLALVQVMSLIPFDRWAPAASWHVAGQFERVRWTDCGGCVYGHVGGGPGITVGSEALLIYLLSDLDVGLGEAFKESWRVGIGARIGVAANLGDSLRWHLEASTLYPVWGDPWRWSWPGSKAGPPAEVTSIFGIKLSSEFQLRLPLRIGPGRLEGGLSLVSYF